MATVVGELEIRLIADIARLQKDMDRVKQITQKTAGAIESTAKSMKVALGGIGFGLLTREVVAMTDAYTKMNAQLKQVARTQEEFNVGRAETKRISAAAQSDITSITTLYQRLSLAIRDTGRSQSDVNKIVETVALGLKANGASARESASAMLQLSQSFGSGRMAGEEFNSMAEAAPNLLRALAKSINVPYGALKGLAAEGKITTEVMANAFTDPELLAGLQEQTKSMRTITGAWTELRNELVLYVGDAAQTTGITKAISALLETLAHNLDTVANVAIAAMIIKSGQYVSSIRAEILAKIEANAATTAKMVLDKKAAQEAMAAAERKAAADAAAMRQVAVKIGADIELTAAESRLATSMLRVATAAEIQAAAMAELTIAQRIATASASMMNGALALIGGVTGGALIIAAFAAWKFRDALIGVQEANDKAVESMLTLDSRLSKMNPQQIAQEIIAANEKLNPLMQEANRINEAAEKASRKLTYAERGRLAALEEMMVPLKSDMSLMQVYLKLSQQTAEAQEVAAEKYSEGANKMIQSLAEQLYLFGKTEREIAIYNATMKAIADKATQPAIDQIVEMTTRLYDQTQAAEDAKTALDRMFDDFESWAANQAEAAKIEQEAFDKVIDEVIALGEVMDQQAEDGKRAAEKVAEAQSKAAEQAARDWADFRDDLGDMFKDSMLDPDGSFFDRLGDSFKQMAAKIVGDMAAAGLMNMLTGKGSSSSISAIAGNAGIAGQIVSATGLAGSLGLVKAGAMSTLGMGNTMIAPGLTSMGGIMTGLGAAMPWIAGAMALASVLDKKSTPSSNAGLLLDPLAGIGGQFATEKFASGLQVTGFARRATQADAEQSIEVFRGIDKTLTELTEKMGIAARPGRAAFTGLAETGQGYGLFLGTAGESGRPGMSMTEQANQFTSQWLAGIKDALKAEDYEAIIAAGGAEAMAEKYKDIVESTTKTLADAAKDQDRILSERMKLQDEYDELTMTSTQLLGKQRNALDESNRALFDQINAVKKATEAEKARIDAFETALESAKDFLAEAYDTQADIVRDHYQEQMRQEEDLHNRRKALFRELMDYTASLRLGGLSPLTPLARLQFAQSQYRGFAATANNVSLSMEERLAAGEKLKGASDQYLTEARSYYASSSPYSDIFAEVMNSLDAAKFLGTSGEFSATPYENAMLAELKSLNEKTAVLPKGIADHLNALMTNLIVQSRLVGNSAMQTANLVSGMGANAIAAGGSTFEQVYGSSIGASATKQAEILAGIGHINRTAGSEAEAVAIAVAEAQKAKLSTAQVAAALGMDPSALSNYLTKFNFASFDVGTNYVPQDMFAQVHKGERIIPAADNAQLMADNKRLVAAVENLTNEVVNLREWQQSADQTKVNKLNEIAQSNSAMNRREDMSKNVKVGGAA